MSNLINVHPDMDDTELETFNHKFGGTLAFDEDRQKWVRINLIEPDQRNILFLGTPDRRYAMHYREVDLRNEEVKLSKRSPEKGFYNYFERGECMYLARLPVRQYKHTITDQVAVFQNRAWELFPAALIQEINGPRFLGNRVNIGMLGYVLNNHCFLPFEEALVKIIEGDMISCAFHRNFMLSVGVAKDNPEALQLWYENIPMGMVNPTTRSIYINKLLLLQEIKDTLKGQNCSWAVVG